jgi:peptide/nickel transport system substrate-binding protein
MPTRRTTLAGTAAALAAATLPRPALSQGAGARVLKFIPHSNLAAVDPVATSGYIVRNYGFMVYDTLFGVDAEFRAKPQMVAAHEVSSDGRVWRFRLRDGLMFHDGTPVRGLDCAASIRRWGARDTMGQTIMRITDAITAPSDREFEIRLKQPFPLMLDALGKLSTQALFVVPERVGNSDPMVPNTETVGSGPFRFVRNEWVPGDRAVFEKFDRYVPRDEPADGATGGKRVLVDRVEWRIIPDPATAAAALQRGEVDWYEQPAYDLLPVLARSRDITIETTDPLGSLMMIRFNQLHPPFDKPAVRRAVLSAVNQDDYLAAVTGNPLYGKPCRSFLVCGTPIGSDQGAARMPGNLEAAKKAVADGGYAGETIVIISPTDIPATHAMGLVTSDLLTKLGMKVEFVATDWGSVLARRSNRNPPAQGGWNIFHTSWAGPDVATPVIHLPLRAHGAQAWAGWPTDPELEALRDCFLESKDAAEQAALVAQIQARGFESVPFVPLGQIQQPTAYRRNVSGIARAPMPFFWGVSRG